MNKRKIFVSCPHWLDLDELIQPLMAAGFDVTRAEVPGGDAQKTIDSVRGYDAAVAFGETWNSDVVNGVKDTVRLLMKYGSGIDTIDLDACTKAGIAVANTAGQNAIAVAEIAVSHMLMLTRKLAEYYSCVKQGTNKGFVFSNELYGKTVGIIGFGNVGRYVARLLKGFNIRCLAYDILIDEKAAEEYQIKYTDLDTLLKESDFVSLHVPLYDKTKGMVNRDFLNRMKPTAYLINTSRGAVVNEADLFEALIKEKIAGAGLDVLVKEPPTLDNPLVKLDNVTITPHIAASSYEAESRTRKYISDCIIGFYEGRDPKTLLNPEYKKY